MLVNSDEHLQYVIPYIEVKNVFDVLPGGFKSSIQHFENSWKKASQYRYSSFENHAKNRSSPLLDDKRIVHLLKIDAYKKLSREMVDAHTFTRVEKSVRTSIQLEAW